MADDCIFCKIIRREIPSKIIAENDDILVIQDIAPKAPTHYLIIPKKHIADVRSLSEADAHLFGNVMLMAKELSSKMNNAPFRLIINNGPEVGQSVFHSHVHYIAGKKMTDF